MTLGRLLPRLPLLWAVLLAAPGAAAGTEECVGVPKGADYAPILTPAVQWVQGDEEVDAPDVNLQPLFDKTSDVKQVDFYSDKNGALRVTYKIPRSLPLLGTLRLAGSGEFEVTIDGLESKVHFHEHLTGGHRDLAVQDTTKDPIAAATVTVEGQEAGSYLTALRFLASAHHQAPADAYDDEGEEGVGGDDTEQYDPPAGGGAAAGEEALPNVTGCACIGWPLDGGNGSKCGHWDGDCPDSGWCYTKPNACEHSLLSSSYPRFHWSCQPCGGNTTERVTAPKPRPSPHPKASTPKPTPAPAAEEDCECTGPMVLGLFGGIAIGVVLAVTGVVLRPRRAPMRRLQRADAEDDDDELGHHD